MGHRKQAGMIVNISGHWHVRYRESRNIGGVIKPQRVSYPLGPVTTRGKRPPADIKTEAARHMATVNSGIIEAARVVTIGDFVDQVYLPWIKEHKRPSTEKGYRDIWEDHLKPHCNKLWLKETRTFHVQGWLNQTGKGGLSRNTLKHIKSVISAIFKLAKQQDYFQGENPARDTAINPGAAEPKETYAYSLDEIESILLLLPEPAATAFAVAAYTGLRHGEIQGLEWEDYHDGALQVSRSIWNGRATAPKTRMSCASVPVIAPLAQRLEMHRLRGGDPQTGPMFANGLGKPLSLGYLLNNSILPALNRCAQCGKPEASHRVTDHAFKRDESIPEWHGWHAARRGLGSNLYRLGVSPKVIQAILRHANVSTTATYYIKTAEADVQSAMTMLEDRIAEANQLQADAMVVVNAGNSSAHPTVQ
jgi:integrase